MLNNKSVAVVIPAFNEAEQIGRVIETMPGFVDRIIVVNDCSKDETPLIVKNYRTSTFNELQSKSLRTVSIHKKKHGLYSAAEEILIKKNREEIRYFAPSAIENTDPEHDRIILISLQKNSGVGAAIARGYKWCKDHEIDCTAVMAGDGQMDPDELETICNPVVKENIDYVKGNRLKHGSAFEVIPKTRFLGNSILSILTKIASGYWHVSDTQTGFTAISLNALNSIRLYKIYTSYGMPNDLLVKLNISFCTLKEVTIKPVYNVGEKSKMKIFRIILPISFLLFKSFFKRLWIKYLIKDFHPLFLLYHLGFVLLLSSIPFLLKLLINMLKVGVVSTEQIVIFFVFLTITGLQSLFFAMWMDIQDNERLEK